MWASTLLQYVTPSYIFGFLALLPAMGLMAISLYNRFEGATGIVNSLPQPKKLPVVGHIGQFKPGLVHDYFLEKTREIGEGKNFGLHLMHEPAVVLNDPHDIQFVLGKGQHHFTKAKAYHQMLDWVIKHNMLITDGEEWKEQRKTFNPTFHFEEMRFVQDHIWKETQLFCEIADECIADNGVMDVSLRWECFTLNVLGHIGFSFKFNAQRESLYREVMRGLMIHCASRALEPWWPIKFWKTAEAHRSVKKLLGAVKPIYDRRKAEGLHDEDDDLLAKMMRAEENGSSWMTKFTGGDPWPQYKDQMALFLFAGSDTTSSLLASTVYLLAKHDDKRKKLQKELDEHVDPIKQPGVNETMHLPYMQACIKEALRLRPSVSMVARRCFEPQTLPSGLKVTPQVNCFVPIQNLHHNKLVWGDDADEFRPERWINDKGELEAKQPHKDKSLSVNEAYVPFAGGQRTCIGQNLARVEAAIALAVVLRRFEFTLTPELEGDKEPVFETAITMGYTNGLPLKIKRRVDQWKDEEAEKNDAAK